MKFKINKSIILVTYIFVSSSLFSQNNSLKREIIAKVIDSINAHNQLEFEMFRSERNEKNEFIDGKFCDIQERDAATAEHSPWALAPLLRGLYLEG